MTSPAVKAPPEEMPPAVITPDTDVDVAEIPPLTFKPEVPTMLPDALTVPEAVR